MTAPGRVAVLVPYWDFFESAVAGDLRVSRAALVEQATAALGETAPLGPLLWIDSAQAGRDAGAALADARPHAVVVLQTMAVPPAWTADALAAVPDVPLVVLVVQDRERPGEPFDHGAVTEQGSTVGGAQLTSTLVRRERPFRLVTGWLGEEAVREELRREVRAARAAGSLRGAHLLRVGRPLEGYECVDADPGALARATGVELVPLETISVADAYRDAPAEAVEAVRAEVAREWELCDADAPGAAVERSLRMAVAIERLDRAHGADGGIMNCHVPEIRLGDEPGVAPCFALGRETSAGRPWTCTGDVVTAVAMLALKRLGAPAWYHEIEALDHGSGEALLASSGEHDRGLAPAGCPLLHANPWWDGLCARFTPDPGPASLVALAVDPSARGGFRLVVAEGDFTERSLPQTGTVNAAFRFARGPLRDAWSRWARAGASHHSAATSGRRGEEIAAVAEHLGLDCTVV